MKDEDVLNPPEDSSTPLDPSAGSTEASTDPKTEANADPKTEARTDPKDLALAAMKAERDEYHDRFLRKAAEFDNYRKRVERERRDHADQAVVDLLQELLLIVDDFERAVAVEHGRTSSAYVKGVELIHTKLQDLLRKQNVRPFESLGADFDPNRHQAVTYETSPEHRDGEVIGELRRGYIRGDRLLRAALVKVAKA